MINNNQSIPIRVLHVVHKMHYAGAETLLMRIYRNIDRTKVQFDFLVHTEQPGHYDEEIRDLGGRIICMSVVPDKKYHLYISVLKNLLIKNGPYTCVHSHLALLSGVILKVSYQVGVPLRIVHSHSTDDGKSNNFFRIIYRSYMRSQIKRYATHMFAVSRPAGEWLFGKNCWHDSRVQVLNNALDLHPYKMLEQDRIKLRMELGLPADGLLLGHVGRFVQSKNHRKILEVFSHLVKLQPVAHLILVGEGPLESEARSLIKSLGLQDQVSMLGVRSDIPRLMGALDAFLFPSHYEGLGIALIEAQAAGVPCLASDIIPSEVDLGLGLVEFLPLSAGCDIWAGKVLSLIDFVRLPWQVREASLTKKHYDIFELTPKLQELYTYESNPVNC